MKNILLFSAMFICIVAEGQKIDYNTIILPMNAADVEFSEKLVRLAWQNNPSVEVLTHEMDQSRYEVKYAKWNWLDNIRVSGNINEFNIDKSSNPFAGSQFYPRYNISATVSLGDIFARPIKIKSLKENVYISNDVIDQKKLEIRAEVLKQYNTFLSHKEIHDLRTQMLEDALSDFKIKEQNFAKGEIVLTEYTQSLDRYNQQKINKILAENDMINSRIGLEELIGVKLSDVQ